MSKNMLIGMAMALMNSMGIAINKNTVLKMLYNNSIAVLFLTSILAIFAAAVGIFSGYVVTAFLLCTFSYGAISVFYFTYTDYKGYKNFEKENTDRMAEFAKIGLGVGSVTQDGGVEH